MTSSTHNIQITKYNRSLLITPKNRIKNRDRIWLNSLKGKVNYGMEVIDDRSAEERAYIRRHLLKVRQRDQFIGGIAVIISIIITVKIYALLF